MIDRLNEALEGRYRVDREIGAGGMATVFLAEDLKHTRQVALKVLRPALALAGDRFLQEIRVTARLQHPGIVPLFDSGEAGGFLHYVMPFIEGETLANRLERDGRIPLVDTLEIARAVATTLEYAHGRGVVHRDIKPSNILFSQGQPLVADFGIARALSAAGSERLTAAGQSLGTPTYMSPEQAAGEDEVDGRADLYSLGCVVHEMLSGQPPFQATSVQALLAAKLTRTPPPLTSVPDDVARLVARTLETSPDARFPDAGELARAVVALMKTAEGDGGGARRDAGPSIVVLPFQNLSPDPDNAYFADGLTEEIISDLSQLEDLRVISRTSAMRYRDSEQPLPTIAGELGVRYVLEGSVRKAAQAIRVTTQLIEAGTDDHLWSGKFKGSLEDVFEIQERISREIVDALQVSLSGGDAARLAGRREEDPRVLDLVMRIRQHMWTFSPEGFRRAEALLEQAGGIVQDSARLTAIRADLMFQTVNLGISSDESRVLEAEKLARQALAMDDRCALAYNTLAWILGSRRKQLAVSWALTRRAVELDPSDSVAQVGKVFISAILGLGDADELDRAADELTARDPFLAIGHIAAWMWATSNGNPGRAIQATERALQLDPGPPFRFMHALSLLELGRREEAEAVLAPALDPEVADGAEGAYQDICVALLSALRGDRDGARENITEAVIAWAEPDPQYCWHVAQTHAVNGDTGPALDWLERAIDNQFWNHTFLARHERLFDPLRDEPRFDALVARAREGWETLSSDELLRNEPWRTA